MSLLCCGDLCRKLVVRGGHTMACVPTPNCLVYMLDLGGPTKFKATKMAAADSQDLIDSLRVPIWYVFSVVDTYLCSR